MAESSFISFQPLVAEPSKWKMDVLGHPVSPLEVVVNGSRHLHAVWRGVNYLDDSAMFVNITSKDVPLLVPGDPAFLLGLNKGIVDPIQPNLEQGFHFNIQNNLWGVAFVEWYPFIPADRNGRARFTL